MEEIATAYVCLMFFLIPWIFVSAVEYIVFKLFPGLDRWIDRKLGFETEKIAKK